MRGCKYSFIVGTHVDSEQQQSPESFLDMMVDTLAAEGIRVEGRVYYILPDARETS